MSGVVSVSMVPTSVLMRPSWLAAPVATATPVPFPLATKVPEKAIDSRSPSGASAAAGAIALLLFSINSGGTPAGYSLLAVGLMNSIMFPTIFSLALHGLGRHTGQGSGILCMAIVGGAIVPFVQGALADTIGLQPSFFVPVACYAFILFFGLKYAKLHLEANAPA